MKIGIIGAMEQEVALLRSHIDDLTVTTIANIEFYSGTLNGTEVVVTRSGIGKVTAAIATTLLVERFAPDAVINTGSAGGFAHNLAIGDVVISSEVRYHDVDVTAFGYEMGQLPSQPAAFLPAQDLVDAAKAAIAEVGEVKAIQGLICTGDSFIADPERTKVMLSHFPAMAACEMEAASIAQTCQQFDLPFVVIRAISDNANDDSAVDFDSFIVKAGEHSAKVVIAMLDKLNR
ncbi:5'-methylthioadenosine/S-adenosylhomocysteine nucleosidase [Ferrimonas sediminicola]|uniref:5'-methylthioadenosine/S-adenosylhomocysteine nucleosidase n=1 Tax=Ferrimonas sediminicola TaxID=2569538 RepID=A0A4U1BN22_9GAMM|nr:5'-methylthioadenosine/S-adenosylhomocysteine nucleosidase [Ferrimonas sediminicola]TKB51518.1 5'-methylthioadenosine/S-adenosylhomocysteine nucleosidase [Ferrimonas sediminicola]